MAGSLYYHSVRVRSYEAVQRPQGRGSAFPQTARISGIRLASPAVATGSLIVPGKLLATAAYQQGQEWAALHVRGS
ncbi:hypothetical protein WJX74_001060 [Apatococcus lobatus]|uniref:Uncharacterized protein n=2 Tax=Apatococcus TaxID=904362 RepID=A0AAW1SWX7_9CHLO